MGNNANGWAAIDQLLENTYPEHPNPLQWTPPPTGPLGHTETLEGIRVYQVSSPVPHWHYVSYGLSDVYGSHPANDPTREKSGMGFELSFRLADAAAATGPATFERVPPWPVSLLLNVASYMRNSGNPVSSGEMLRLNGPVEVGGDTPLRCLGFAHDAVLPELITDSGSVFFLQLVGMTEPEYAAGESWMPAKIIAEVMARTGQGITDVNRPDLMAQSDLAEVAAEGARTDGSATGILYVEHAHLSTDDDGVPAVELGATALRALAPVLPGRVPFGRDLVLGARETGVMFRQADNVAIIEQESTGTGIVRLTDSAATQLAALPIKAGTYDVAGLRVRILKSPITDQQGNLLHVVGE